MQKVVLIGCGNITNLRHLPALQSLKKKCEVLGVIGIDPIRTNLTAKKAKTSNIFIGDILQEDPPNWLRHADLVVIGTPPMTHVRILDRVLSTNKTCRVLVEKPFSLGSTESPMVQKVSNQSHRISVMHNFQFSNGMKKVTKWIEGGRLGSIKSINGIQFSTNSRRLPVWYEELPLGLFWDESAHFIYLVRKLVGEVDLYDAHALCADTATPQVLTIGMRSTSGVPINITMNFYTSISEWGLVVSGTRGVASYDFFRDIASFVPNDGKHLPIDILRTSVQSIVSHIVGFAKSGLMFITGRLHYGVDHVMDLVLSQRTSHPDYKLIDFHAALTCVAVMQEVQTRVSAKRDS